MKASALVSPLLVAAAAFFFSIMSLFAKQAGLEKPTTSFGLLLFRSTLGLAINLVVIGVRQLWLLAGSIDGGSGGAAQAEWLTPSKAGWLAVRAIGGSGSILLEFYSLLHIDLEHSMIILYSSPAFIVLFCALLFGEPLKPLVVACLACCFAGVCVTIQPWRQGLQAEKWHAYAAAVLAAAMAGFVYVALRELKGVPYYTVQTCFQLTCVVLALVMGASFEHQVAPTIYNDDGTWDMDIAGFAVAAYCADTCITLGYARAGEAIGYVSVLKFLSPVLGTVWAVLLLSESVGWYDLIGGALILGPSALVLFLQAQKKVPEEQGGPDLLAAAAEDETGSSCAEESRGLQAAPARPDAPDSARSSASSSHSASPTCC